jgi:hypothetical protein
MKEALCRLGDPIRSPRVAKRNRTAEVQQSSPGNDEDQRMVCKFLHCASKGNLYGLENAYSTCTSLASASNTHAQDALVRASISGHLHILEFLITECQVSVNYENANGKTPLMCAVREATRYPTSKKRQKVVQYLATEYQRLYAEQVWTELKQITHLHINISHIIASYADNTAAVTSSYACEREVDVNEVVYKL